MLTESLAGKVVLITGAGRSLGRAFAESCAEAGAFVVATDIEDPEPLEAPSGRSLALRLDVTRPDHWEDAMRRTIQEFGSLDGLVNNAAVYFGRHLLSDDDPEDFGRLLDVNVRGPWLGLRAAVRTMHAGGSIVNLSSTSGLIGVEGYAAYGATRWAVRGLTKHAAAEFTARGIRVNSLHPRAVSGTGMFPQHRDELPTPGDVSAAVVFLLSDAAKFVSGRELVIDGGATVGAAS